MKRKGSITVFLSLTFLIVLTLISAAFYTAKLSADRAAVAIGTDEAVFSLFSCYDRDLFDLYDVFFIDAGGEGDLAGLTAFVKESLTEIYEPSHAILTGGTLLTVSPDMPSLDAYTTASEQDGLIFAEQAVQYMKDTLGLQALAGLGEAMSSSSAAAAQESAGAAVDAEHAGAAMNDLKTQAAAAAAANAAEGGTAEAAPAVQEGFVNPVDTIKELQKRTLLDLVVPDPGSISTRSADASGFLSARSRFPSLGVVETTGEAGTASGKLLFNEYLLSHCGSFLAPGEGALGYELEYILFGKEQDRANLDAAAKKLLLIRTGANAVQLFADPVLHASVTEWSSLIAAALAVPEFEPLIETILIAAWAWAESILDVRALFSGKKTALIKTSENWQLRLENLPLLLSSPDSLIKDAPGGMSYRDYLRTFLLTASAEKVRMRFLDMAESVIRISRGRPSFRLDRCLDTVSLKISFLCEGKVTYETAKRASYRFDF